ncbi:membrane protein DedA with SNARE-associated domain [Saccharothrix saharensis]|uniref:Membrane protein DedA with SNARE-associated domain n=1 Tax=Saccharothrix saharensis TaxID=571190 RepID=A0A543JD98_9PSEU|nr:DedA family protein [Saccharothrix saharensis]TQM80756.1 membrane protein DedA with SNARE-associated domain [Saccharothrix saharensis]
MDVVSWVTDMMEALGAPGAGIAIALENLFPPLPSELFLPLAGFTASQGKMNLLAAILWTTTGSVAGALALYYLGALLGRDRIRAIAQRLPLVDVSDVDRTEQWFARHGKATVFFGRMVPIFRSLISIPAGVERMPLPSFLLLTAAGSLIWNSALILAGYVLGENYHLIDQYMGVVSKVVIGLVVVAVAWFVVSRLSRQKKKAQTRK